MYHSIFNHQSLKNYFHIFVAISIAIVIPNNVMGSDSHIADCNMGVTSPFIQVEGVGWEGQGAGVAFADLNQNGKPDIVLMAYDNPPHANKFKYRIGWDYDYATGSVTRWGTSISINGVGWEGDGAGIAIADINGNGILDMILMAYDAPNGANNFRYRVGWDLSNSGTTNDWSNTVEINGVGYKGEGAGIAIADIDGNGILDMVLMAYDAPNDANNFRYRVGWNLSNEGTTNNWSNPIEINGVGYKGEGADIALADIDLDGTLDIVLMAYDAPGGANNFRYRIGWHLENNGTVRELSRWYRINGVGHHGQGAGLAYHYGNLRTGPRLIIMAYDNPERANNFRYTMLPITTSGTTFAIADDLPPAPDDNLSVPSSAVDQTADKLLNLNMSNVQKTANDALSEYIFVCGFVKYLNKTAETPVCWANESNTSDNINIVEVYGNDHYSQEMDPDMLVTAVEWYVDRYMGYTSDKANKYVINTIHNLGYATGGDAIPAHYTIKFTDPERNPTLVQELNAYNPDWASAYNDGKSFHGDCEDFALLRHALLRALGFDRHYIWNAGSPGHEFNVVLYRGSYRIMDYGPISDFSCKPTSITRNLHGVWNTDHGPRWCASTGQYLYDYILKRGYPDRCTTGLGWVLNRRALPVNNNDTHCCK